MANLTLSPCPKLQFFDDEGVIVAGGLLYTYAAGTSDKLATYTDVGGLVPHANPIELDSAGRVPSGLFLLPASYKFILSPAGDTDPPTDQFWSQDNIGATPSTTIDQDVAVTVGENIVTPEVLYGSDGSGALTAGRWYKASSDNTYSSTTPLIAFAVADALAGGASTARTGGRMTGFLGLTVGASYYVGSTAGTITTTPAANSRYVGWADSTTSLIVSPNPSAVTSVAPIIDERIKSICNGRLTLTTNVPVTTTDVTAATTLYWTPYHGNEIGLYNGTQWVSFACSELSIAVPATTATMYDVFVDYNAGVPALSLTAWTNLTTPATALTTQDGVPVLTGATGKRHVGWMRTTAVSGQAEDSEANRWVRNRYNRVPRSLKKIEATDSWNYTTATYRQANAAATNKVGVIGDGASPIDLTLTANASNGGTINVWAAIGYDSTTVPVGAPCQSVATNSIVSQLTTRIVHYPGAGSHDYNWLERSTASGTTTWYGDNGDATLLQSGMFGVIQG